jgi:hypothetical protein
MQVVYNNRGYDAGLCGLVQNSDAAATDKVEALDAGT